MLPERRVPTHPGVVLLEEFLKPLGMSQAAFARHIGVPAYRIHDLVHGRRNITPDLAWRFSQALNTSPEFWVNLQARFDLARARPSSTIQRLVPEPA